MTSLLNLGVFRDAREKRRTILTLFALRKKLCHYFFSVFQAQTVHCGMLMKSGEMGLIAVKIQMSRNPLKNVVMRSNWRARHSVQFT